MNSNAAMFRMATALAGVLILSAAAACGADELTATPASTPTGTGPAATAAPVKSAEAAATIPRALMSATPTRQTVLVVMIDSPSLKRSIILPGIVDSILHAPRGLYSTLGPE